MDPKSQWSCLRQQVVVRTAHCSLSSTPVRIGAKYSVPQTQHTLPFPGSAAARKRAQ